MADKFTDRFNDKLLYSLIMACVFFVCAYVTKFIGLTNENGCLIEKNHLIATSLFFVILLAIFIPINLMKPIENRRTIGKTIKYSFLTSMMFFFLTSSATYKYIIGNLGNAFATNISDKTCPTFFGVLVHTIVFFGLKFGMMFSN